MSRRFTGATYLSRTSSVLTSPPWTLAGWVRPRSTTSEVLALSVGSSASDTVNNATIRAAGGTAGDPARYVITGAAVGAQLNSTTGFKSGQWNHVCGVSKTISNHAVFLNAGGKAVDTTSMVSFGAMNRTSIGAAVRTTVTLQSIGDVADVGAWGVGLTDGEVLMLAQGARPWEVRPDALVACWLTEVNVSPGVIDTNPFQSNRFPLVNTNSAPHADRPPVRVTPKPIWSRGVDIPTPPPAAGNFVPLAGPIGLSL